VVDHDHRRAGRLGRARDEARVGFVEPLPVAAVNEDVYRRGWAPRGEHVEPFAGMRTIREIEPALERGAGLGAGDRVPREPVGAVLHLLAVVVLGVERRLVVVPKDASAHEAPKITRVPATRASPPTAKIPVPHAPIRST